MIDRRTILRGSGAVALGALALGALALGAVAGGTPALAQDADQPTLLPDPATTPVPNPPFPHGLSHAEREHLETVDTLDFDVFTHDRHIADLQALFVWAPDTRIHEHPIRLAMNELTAVVGVMRGTFTRPMPDGRGGLIQPTGKAYAISMATVGIWNPRRGYMDEEFLFWDNQSFFAQIGLG